MCGAVFPPCYLTWGQPMVEVMKITVASSKGPMQALLYSVPPTLQKASVEPRLHQRLLATHRQVWVNLLLGHCSFLLVLVFTRFCLCPPSVFPQSSVSSGSSMVGLMATSSKRAYAIPKSAAPSAASSAAVNCWPVSTQETLKHCSVSVSLGSLGPGAHKVCLRRCWRKPKLERRPFPPPPHIKGFSDIWTLQFLATKARPQSFWGISLHCASQCLHWTRIVSHVLHTYAVSA